jgi:hypothetical protein
MVLLVYHKTFHEIPNDSFSFQLPDDVAAISIQYATVEFRSSLKGDTPGKRRAILDYDASTPHYDLFPLSPKPNTGFNYLTVL